MNTDPRVDAYIAEAPSFARPILEEVRARLRKACPTAEETIKWNVPFYVLGGKLLASMAAFKQHAKIGVWADMRPTFHDVTSVAELPSAKDFAESVTAAAGLLPAPKSAAKKSAPASKKAAPKPKASAPAAKKPAAKKSKTKKPAVRASGKPRARASKT